MTLTGRFTFFLYLVINSAVRNNHYGPTGAPVPYTLRAYWMRHGKSCANAIMDQRRLGRLMQHLYKDPGLTNCGVEFSKMAGGHVWPLIAGNNSQWFKDEKNQFLLFSSTLVRAMETAMYAFPLSPGVRPIPYISEDHSSLPDNKPMSWEDQVRYRGLGGVQPVIFEMGNPANHTGRKTSDYGKFLSYFPELLKSILSLIPSTDRTSTPIPVVIVSHSGFMRKSLKLPRMPRNNEVWVQEYHFIINQDGTASDLGPHGPCVSLMEQSPTANVMPPSLPDIIERCRDKVSPLNDGWQKGMQVARVLGLADSEGVVQVNKILPKNTPGNCPLTAGPWDPQEQGDGEEDEEEDEEEGEEEDEEEE